MADRGQTILAVEAGTLVSVGWSDISGNKIWLVADDGAAYFYAHLNGFARGIETGTRVVAGQDLGTVGNTGNASGGAAHLHFEIHPGGRTASSINPYYPLRTAQNR
jgi:murein DD-endopeptidase MepM/ murein hydrolase activator NlpD